MSASTMNTALPRQTARPPAAAHAHTPPDDLAAYFRTRLPVMLDGAVRQSNERTLLLNRARRSLQKGAPDPARLPAEILRETLDAIAAAPAPKTMAGAAPVGPHHARVWWDEHVLDSLGDVLARLDDPRLVLRFYDITGLDPEEGRWHDSFDLDVELHETGRTVQFWSADRTYAVDLGYVHADGRFLRLARTNTVDLPRDSAGKTASGETALSRLRRAADKTAPYTTPDTAAEEWDARRPDSERRDRDAELVVHMLYRAFLLEGPRALRRVPALVRRDTGVLREEFSLRQRRRARATAKPARAASAFLVRRLDIAPAAAPAPTMEHLPVLAALVKPKAEAKTVVRPPAVSRPRAHIRVADEDIPAALFAAPVFEAAKNLRESLAGIHPLDSAVLSDTFPARIRKSASGPAVPIAPVTDEAQVFDAAEAKRLAKAGVRVSRMSLTLEGRMRPGARLKVAGKLVHADADGRFRLECVLSGRRTSIPMRAGVSVSGEARSLISIDWSKRPAHKSVEA